MTQHTIRRIQSGTVNAILFALVVLLFLAGTGMVIRSTASASVNPTAIVDADEGYRPPRHRRPAPPAAHERRCTIPFVGLNHKKPKLREGIWVDGRCSPVDVDHLAP